MWEAAIGLTVGGILTVLTATVIHKTFEYGKREGIVQDGSDARDEEE